MCPGVGLEGWLSCFAHPFGGVVCWGHAQHPAFAPDTLILLPAPQKWQLGFWSLCIWLFMIRPNCACTQLFLVPYSFFVFCCWRRRLSRCKHYSKGSQVPACLTQIYELEISLLKVQSGKAVPLEQPNRVQVLPSCRGRIRRSLGQRALPTTYTVCVAPGKCLQTRKSSDSDTGMHERLLG